MQFTASTAARPVGHARGIIACKPASAAAIALLVAACGRAPAPPVDAPLPAVDVTAATERNIARGEEFVGEVRGRQDVEIRARVQGYLEGIHFRPGSDVKAGALLFTIDPKPFEAALAQARAGLTQAQVEATRTKTDAERYTDLAARGLVPRKQGDDARAQAEVAAANVSAARAVVKAKEVDLGYTRIASPIAGRVGLVGPAVGDLVGQPGGPPLTTVSDLTAVRVRFSVAETDYLRIFKQQVQRLEEREGAAAVAKATAPGRRADPPEGELRLALADGALYPLPGRILSVDRSIDAKTGSLSVEAEFPNPQGMLLPGQFARIRGETAAVENAILVPQKAVTTVQGAASVYVLGAGDVIESRRVEGKELGDGLWQVTSGLVAGEKVVVDGQLKVRAGARVAAREVPIEAGSPVLPGAAPPPAGPSAPTAATAAGG